MSSIEFAKPIPQKRIDEIIAAAGDKVTHDGRHFLFDGEHVWHRLGKQKILQLTRDMPCPIHVKPHEEGSRVGIAHGVFVRRGNKWVVA